MLPRKTAIIQRRLRVWILPVDSKVESSNMARLPKNAFSRAGREFGCLSDASALPDPRARLGVKLARGAGLESLRNSQSEPLY